MPLLQGILSLGVAVCMGLKVITIPEKNTYSKFGVFDNPIKGYR